MIVEAISQHKLIAVVRASEPSALPPAADAMARGGIRVIEFSFTGDGVLDALGAARQSLPQEVLLGAGTVLDAPTAMACVEAGAQFIVSPTFKESTQTACTEAGVPTIPGGATPTEIQRAWEAGAAIVKVFPAAVLGPRFFTDVNAPLPQIPLAAFGGVSLETVGDFLQAGAVAVGVATGLVGRDLDPASDWDMIADRAKAYVSATQVLSPERV